MSNDINLWIKYSEFMGETKEAVKDVRNELQKINKTQINLGRKLDELNNKLTNQTIKIGTISGILGLLGGLSVSILLNVLI